MLALPALVDCRVRALVAVTAPVVVIVPLALRVREPALATRPLEERLPLLSVTEPEARVPDTAAPAVERVSKVLALEVKATEAALSERVVVPPEVIFMVLALTVRLPMAPVPLLRFKVVPEEVPADCVIVPLPVAVNVREFVPVV